MLESAEHDRVTVKVVEDAVTASNLVQRHTSAHLVDEHSHGVSQMESCAICLLHGFKESGKPASAKMS